nr:MAG TPA: hypothetical protein [Caudoviricetes sp.]
MKSTVILVEVLITRRLAEKVRSRNERFASATYAGT